MLAVNSVSYLVFVVVFNDFSFAIVCCILCYSFTQVVFFAKHWICGLEFIVVFQFF